MAGLITVQDAQNHGSRLSVDATPTGGAWLRFEAHGSEPQVVTMELSRGQLSRLLSCLCAHHFAFDARE